MQKIIAVVNVVAWSGFWAFGYLALTSDMTDQSSMVVAAILAFAGAAVGIVAYFWLVRHAEQSGYAKKSNQVPREHHRIGEA